MKSIIGFNQNICQGSPIVPHNALNMHELKPLLTSWDITLWLSWLTQP